MPKAIALENLTGKTAKGLAPARSQTMAAKPDRAGIGMSHSGVSKPVSSGFDRFGDGARTIF